MLITFPLFDNEVIFQDENASYHRVKSVMNFSSGKAFNNSMTWAANSPDLNLNETL